jgi:hypothetical protein
VKYSPEQRVFDALVSLETRRGSLVFVPDVVGGVVPPLTVRHAHEVLLRLAESGIIELRPESGLVPLSARELRLAPRSLGVPLTYARRLK